MNSVDHTNWLDRIRNCFEEAVDRWNGCDWPTIFGRAGLNLESLTSAQVLLLARATAGREAEAWREAAAWLTGIEVDAGDARGRAKQALRFCQENRWAEAMEQADEVVRLESRYHRIPVWQPFRDAVEAAFRARIPSFQTTSNRY